MMYAKISRFPRLNRLACYSAVLLVMGHQGLKGFAQAVDSVPGVPLPQQVKDDGAADLGIKVSDEILAEVALMLKQAKADGAGMPEPYDLMPAQEALQWISNRTYMLEPTSKWPTPDTVEQRMWSDCKGKSVWLADRLLRLGFRNVRIMVGKVPDMLTGHAWVELDYPVENKNKAMKSYILDGTYRGRFSIIPKDQHTVHAEHQIIHVISPDGYTK